MPAAMTWACECGQRFDSAFDATECARAAHNPARAMVVVLNWATGHTFTYAYAGRTAHAEARQRLASERANHPPPLWHCSLVTNDQPDRVVTA